MCDVQRCASRVASTKSVRHDLKLETKRRNTCLQQRPGCKDVRWWNIMCRYWCDCGVIVDVERKSAFKTVYIMSVGLVWSSVRFAEEAQRVICKVSWDASGDKE